MTRYELLLFVHVLAATAWFGAVFFVVLVFELALRSDDRSALLRLIEIRRPARTHPEVRAGLQTFRLLSWLDLGLLLVAVFVMTTKPF